MLFYFYLKLMHYKESSIYDTKFRTWCEVEAIKRRHIALLNGWSALSYTVLYVMDIQYNTYL